MNIVEEIIVSYILHIRQVNERNQSCRSYKDMS